MFGKKEDTLLCPFDKKACIKERCVGWQTGPTEKTVDGVKQVVLHSDCFVIWDLIYKRAIAHRTDGTQAAVESFRNEMVKANQQTQHLLVAGANIAKLLTPEPPSRTHTLGKAKDTNETHDHSE